MWLPNWPDASLVPLVCSDTYTSQGVAGSCAGSSNSALLRSSRRSARALASGLITRFFFGAAAFFAFAFFFFGAAFFFVAVPFLAPLVFRRVVANVLTARTPDHVVGGRAVLEDSCMTTGVARRLLTERVRAAHATVARRSAARPRAVSMAIDADRSVIDRWFGSEILETELIRRASAPYELADGENHSNRPAHWWNHGLEGESTLIS